MNVPAELKYIAPYLQRAQELQERDPIVSYYAQYYAATLAISRGPSNAETKAFLSQLLDKLEQLKAAQAGNEAITNDERGYAHIENFALKVFLNADNEDRAGKASKKTAKTFLAASIFLELLKTFGDLDPDVEAKIKYAKWKAADIMKALKEGRIPTPGAPGEAQSSETAAEQPSTGDVDDLPAQAPSSISEFPSPPSNFTAPLPGNSPDDKEQPVARQPSSPPPPPSNVQPSMPAPQTSQPTAKQETSAVAPSPITSTSRQSAPPSTSIDARSIASAQKHAKWAISALNYDDIATARTQLLMALNDIGYNQANNFGY